MNVLLMLFLSASLHGGAAAVTGEHSLAIGETLKLQLPDLKTVPEQCFLRMTMRLDSARYRDGGTRTLRISINGLPVTIERLANKMPYFLYGGKLRIPYYDDSRRWTVCFNEYGHSPSTRPGAPLDDYVFDVANLLCPGRNVLELENAVSKTSDHDPATVLRIKEIQLLTDGSFGRNLDFPDRVVSQSHALRRFRMKAIGNHRGVEARLNSGPDYRSELTEPVAPRRDFSQDYRLDVDGTGRMFLSVGEEPYEIYSQFAFGNAEWLGIGENTAYAWTSIQAGPDTVQALTPQAALTRSIVRNPTHIEIRDRVVNRTYSALPLAFINQMDLKDPAEITECRIAGEKLNRFWANTSGADNSTSGRRFTMTPMAFAARKQSSVGIVAEDDFYRNHLSFMAWDATLALGDDMFYLPPGGEYTFVWKIYPRGDRDYYSFINTVRRDWNLYENIPGLLAFMTNRAKGPLKTDEQLRRFFDDTGIVIALNVPEYRLKGNSQHLLYGCEDPGVIAEGAVRPLAFVKRVRDAGIPVTHLPYTNPHLVRTLGESDLGHPGKWRDRLADSVLHSAEGEVIPYSGSGNLFLILPTLDTLCGKLFLRAMHQYLDLGYDGIYVDEWGHSKVRISYEHHDGHSALLDENLNITRKIGMIPILIRDFQVHFVNELRKRSGAPIFANHFDNTLAASQLPVCHFAEPGAIDDAGILEAAVIGRTPLSLSTLHSKDIWRDAVDLMRRGLLMCFYTRQLKGDHIYKCIYPITVREVHPGYVIADDKIVTVSSGVYTLGNGQMLQAEVYTAENETGKHLRTVTQNAETVAVALNPDEMAVITAVGPAPRNR
jgi:hypothetical protein